MLAAQHHLTQGILSESFPKLVVTHSEAWLAGQILLGNVHESIPIERCVVCSESYIQAVLKILDKTTETLKTVRIGRKPKPFLART